MQSFTYHEVKERKDECYRQSWNNNEDIKIYTANLNKMAAKDSKEAHENYNQCHMIH